MSEVYEHDKPPFVINGGVDNDASREYEDASKVVIDLDAHTPSETSPVIKSFVLQQVAVVASTRSDSRPKHAGSSHVKADLSSQGTKPEGGLVKTTEVHNVEAGNIGEGSLASVDNLSYEDSNEEIPHGLYDMNDVELQDGMSLLPRKAAMKSSRHTLDVEGLIEEDKSPNTVSEGLSNIKEFLEKRDEFLAVEYTTKPWDVMHPNELMRAEHDNRVAGARNDAVDLQEPASVIPTRSEGGEMIPKFDAEGNTEQVDSVTDEPVENSGAPQKTAVGHPNDEPLGITVTRDVGEAGLAIDDTKEPLGVDVPRNSEPVDHTHVETKETSSGEDHVPKEPATYVPRDTEDVDKVTDTLKATLVADPPRDMEVDQVQEPMPLVAIALGEEQVTQAGDEPKELLVGQTNDEQKKLLGADVPVDSKKVDENSDEPKELRDAMSVDQVGDELKQPLGADVPADAEKVDQTIDEVGGPLGADVSTDAEKVDQARHELSEPLGADAHQDTDVNLASVDPVTLGVGAPRDMEADPEEPLGMDTPTNMDRSTSLDDEDRTLAQPESSEDIPNFVNRLDGGERSIVNLVAPEADARNEIKPEVPVPSVTSPLDDTEKPQRDVTDADDHNTRPEKLEDRTDSLSFVTRQPMLLSDGIQLSEPISIGNSAEHTTDDHDTELNDIETAIETTGTHDGTEILIAQKEEQLLESRLGHFESGKFPELTENPHEDDIEIPLALEQYEDNTANGTQTIHNTTVTMEENKTSDLAESPSHIDPEQRTPQKGDELEVNLAPSLDDKVEQSDNLESSKSSIVEETGKLSSLLDKQTLHAESEVVGLDSIFPDAPSADPKSSQPAMDWQGQKPETTGDETELAPLDSDVDLPPVGLTDTSIPPEPSEYSAFSQQEKFSVEDHPTPAAPADLIREVSHHDHRTNVQNRDTNALDSDPPYESSETNDRLPAHDDQSSHPVKVSTTAETSLEDLVRSTSAVDQDQSPLVPEDKSLDAAQASEVPHIDPPSSAVSSIVGTSTIIDAEHNTFLLHGNTPAGMTASPASAEPVAPTLSNPSNLPLEFNQDGGTLESDPLNGPSTISDVTIAEIELSPHTGEEDPHLVRDQNKTFERISSPSATIVPEEKVLKNQADFIHLAEEINKSIIRQGQIPDQPGKDNVSSTSEKAPDRFTMGALEEEVHGEPGLSIGPVNPLREASEHDGDKGSFPGKDVILENSEKLAAAVVDDSPSDHADPSDLAQLIDKVIQPIEIPEQHSVNETAVDNSASRANESLARNVDRNIPMYQQDERTSVTPLSTLLDVTGENFTSAQLTLDVVDGESIGHPVDRPYSSLADDDLSGTPSFSDSHGTDEQPGPGLAPPDNESLKASVIKAGGTDFIASERSGNVPENISPIIASVLHADPDAIDFQPSDDGPSLLERVHARAFSGESIEGFNMLSLDGPSQHSETPYPDHVPYAVTRILTTSLEKQIEGTPASQFTPVRTSPDDPDVVIIHDAQGEPSDALGPGQGSGDQHVTNNDLSYATLQVELEVEQSVEIDGDASRVSDHTETTPTTGDISRDDVIAAEHTREPVSVAEDFADSAVPAVDASDNISGEKPSDLVGVSLSQEEELSVVRGTVSQAEASMREDSELDLELSDQIVQNEVNVELQQVEKDHPAVQMLEMASVPVESDKVVEAEEQAPSIDIPVGEPSAITKLSVLVSSTTPAAVTPAEHLDKLNVEPEVQSNSPEDASTPVDVYRQGPCDNQIPIRPFEASLISPDVLRQSEIVEDDTSTASGIPKGPLITRVLLEKKWNVPEASVGGDGETIVHDGDSILLTAENVADTPFDADTTRSDVPEVATTPRSELGVFTPTFDSRSEVSAASNEPIPSLSPRTDPSSPTAEEFDLPELALSAGVLTPDAEVEAQTVPDISLETISEASIESIPPSSPVHDITPLSTPTKQDSISQSPKLNPLDRPTDASPDTSLKLSTQDTTPPISKAAVDVAPMDSDSNSPGPEGIIVLTENERPSAPWDSTPRNPQNSLLSDEAEQNDDDLDGVESKSTLPLSWAVSPEDDQPLNEVSQQLDGVAHDLDTMQVSTPPSPQARQDVPDDPVVSSVGERFPSIERTPAQIIPLPMDDDDSSSKPSDSLDVPSARTRSRLISTASSRLLPGGWKTDTPKPQGRASMEMAQGEFSPPMRPQEVSSEDVESKKSGTKCLLM